MDLRVCHIQFAYYPGQGSTDIYEYTQNLAKLGVDVSVIVIGRKNEKEFSNINGVEIYRVLTEKGGRMPNLAKYLKKAGEILNYIEKQKEIDIIHIYYTSGISNILKSHWKTKFLKILDIRSGPIPLWYLSKVKTLKKMQLFFMSSWLQNEAKKFDAKIVPDLKIGLNLFSNCEKLFEVPLGANFDLFYPGINYELREKLRLNCKNVLVYTGAVYPQRKLDVLLKSIKFVVENHNQDIILLILGQGPDVNRLMMLSHQLGIHKNIAFLGFKPYTELPEYLRVADIAISFIPLSREYEYQPPLKTVEYLASGLPTIGTTTYGNRKFIRHKINGILCKDDPKELSKWIQILIEDKTLKRKIKKRSRNSVLEYDWKQIVKKKLLPTYKVMLNDRI